jgi:hypothetical protein
LKKSLLAMAAVAAIMFSANAQAVDSTGCGLGSLAWRGQGGMVPQVLAVTTNGTFGNQTFGITSGTSGCDPQGRVTGGTGRMTLAFLEDNLEQFAMDASAGRGETIETIAGILNVDSEKLGAAAQQNFAYLFTDENVEAVDLALKMMELANA